MTVSSHRRPVSIAGARFIVRELDRAVRFYEQALGLTTHVKEPARAELGAPDAPFLTLIASPSAEPPDPRRQGLFHMAYLLPERSDLAAWARHARALGASRIAASDHGVSEAFYFDDPEGNGIEIYADRPDAEWPREPNGALIMYTRALDLRGLDKEAGDWRGAPEGMRIGHAHLQVDDVAHAAARYVERLALDPVLVGYDAAFLGAGGYHHHVAANIWRSAGAPTPREGAAGLAELIFDADPATYARIAAAAGRGADAPEVSFDDPAARRIVVRRPS